MNVDGENADVDIGFPLYSFSFSILSKSTFNYWLPRPVLLFSLTPSLPTCHEDIAAIHCVLIESEKRYCIDHIGRLQDRFLAVGKQPPQFA